VICLQNLYNEHIPMMSGCPEHVPDDPPFGTLQFISDETESVLQDLDVNKGSGHDGISPKNCASAFAKPLSLLLNRSMATSVFSDR
jgi:hypothetical protein